MPLYTKEKRGGGRIRRWWITTADLQDAILSRRLEFDSMMIHFFIDFILAIEDVNP